MIAKTAIAVDPLLLSAICANLRPRLRGVAQSGSAPALGAGSRRFKSSHPDHDTFALFPLALALSIIGALAPVAQLDRAGAF